MVFVGELIVREVFCVAGKIKQPAFGIRLGVRSSWEIYFVCVVSGGQPVAAGQVLGRVVKYINRARLKTPPKKFK